MNNIEILSAPDETILETARQLRLAYKLKTTIRYGDSRNPSVHSESVAEHVYALLFLAQYFLPIEDPGEKLSKERVYEILLFHDFGEIVNGDIPYHMKTAAHEMQEMQDAQTVFNQLPLPVSVAGRARWQEYEDNKTPEARFVFALDKIEPIFELLDSINAESLKRTKFTYQHHIEKKMRATEEFPAMRRFVEVLSNDMQRRKVFWEE